MSTTDQLPGVEIFGSGNQQVDDILTSEALKFIVDLERRFGPRVRHLLDARNKRQKRIDAGERPNFLPETADVRNSDWTVSSLPPDLLDRRVEITGPVDRKMIINALNSGAKVFMADFEDSNTPTWSNLILSRARHINSIQTLLSSWCARGAGTYRKNMWLSTVTLCRARCSILDCFSGTTPPRKFNAQLSPTSTCPNSRVTWKHGFGTMSFYTRKIRLGSRLEPSKRPS
jgi:Malate synthase